MRTLITGATGFIGKHLIDRLLAADDGPISVLIRPESKEKWGALVAQRWSGSANRFTVVEGDVRKEACGCSDAAVEALKGKIDHIYHLAAIYDLTAPAEESMEANVTGTANLVALANRLGAPAQLQYASSVAVAGGFPGTFNEEMFDVGQPFPNAYFKSKFEAEKIVRDACEIPYRIYRPGAVIGHSVTGEADRIDGPYYGFMTIKKIRNAFPPWLPLLGFEGAQVPVVPVDYVVEGMLKLAGMEGLDGKAFHLFDPQTPSVGEMMNAFCRAAGAAQFTARIDNKIFSMFPKNLLGMIGRLGVVSTLRKELFDVFEVPESIMEMIRWPTRLKCETTTKILEAEGVRCPALDSYAKPIWNYWEEHLDPRRVEEHTLESRLAGKRALVTGASSGIGLVIAQRIAEAGGKVLLVARSKENLDQVADDIRAKGGQVEVHPADLSSQEDCDRLVKEVLERHGGVDVLINNAGRSIRRTLAASYDRFHDYERTIQLNYFGALKLILGFLPGMRERKIGHILNISSIGAQTNAPRFSAYVASKSALDSFSRSMASEVIGDGVHVTTVYMPLVRTPMIAPTKIYESMPAISPEEAAEMVLGALITRKKKIATRLGTFGEVMYALAPKVVDRILSLAYRLFPDSSSSEGKSGGQSKLSDEAVIFAYLLRGVHW